MIKPVGPFIPSTQPEYGSFQAAVTDWKIGKILIEFPKKWMQNDQHFYLPIDGRVITMGILPE